MIFVVAGANQDEFPFVQVLFPTFSAFSDLIVLLFFFEQSLVRT